MATVSFLTMTQNYFYQIIGSIIVVHFGGLQNSSLKLPSPICWIECIPISNPAANLKENSQGVLFYSISSWWQILTSTSDIDVKVAFLNFLVLSLSKCSPGLPLYRQAIDLIPALMTVVLLGIVCEQKINAWSLKSGHEFSFSIGFTLPILKSLEVVSHPEIACKKGLTEHVSFPRTSQVWHMSHSLCLAFFELFLRKRVSDGILY